MFLPPLRTPGFAAWVTTAGPRTGLWRIVASVLLAGAAWLASVAGLAGIAGRLLPGGASAETVLLLYLASFAGLVAGLACAVRLLHGRDPATLTGPGRRIDGRRFLAGVAVVATIGAAGLLPLALIAPPVRQLSLASWASGLALALPLILVQAAGEELVFRGYLQTQLAARFESPLVWWALPAAVFGALHWNPAEFGENAPLMVASAGLMGLVLGDVTARTGNLWLAIGLHFANNVLAMLVVATPSGLSGLSLYLSPLDTGDPGAVRIALLGNLALIAGAYAVWLWRQARRRRAPGRAG